jgi:RNA-directed DNA polymerase
VRYADDFLVFARNPWEVEWYVLPKLRKFLATRGLSLSEAKTRVTTRAAGFNFLGFTFKQVWTKNSKILLVTPQKEKVKHLLGSVKAILAANKQATIEQVVVQLNLLIRGWANYYRHCHASRTFKHVDYRVFRMVWRWCVRRHLNKGRRWVKYRYFLTVGNRHWVFGTKGAHLTAAQATHVTKYVKVKGASSPFDPTLRAYWEGRVKRALANRYASALKGGVLAAQGFRCAACHFSLREDDPIHFHHVIPRKDGGPTNKGNLQAVHQRCHAPHARRQRG